TDILLYKRNGQVNPSFNGGKPLRFRGKHLLALGEAHQLFLVAGTPSNAPYFEEIAVTVLQANETYSKLEKVGQYLIGDHGDDLQLVNVRAIANHVVVATSAYNRLRNQ